MRIGIYAFDDVTMFHLSVPQLVFDEVAHQGLGTWKTFLFGDGAPTIRTAEGYRIGGLAGLDEAREANVVVMPSWFFDGRPAGEAVRTTLTTAHEAGATVVGLCLGAIPVVDAGLLTGRAAVTHWQAFDLLSQRHPELDLDDSVLYIDHGDVLTSAGTASGLDACLHLVRSRLGATAANKVARSLVIAPHREGGQAQYIERPMPPRSEGDAISRAMEWAEQRLAEPLPVERLAATVHMSTRTFVRAFRAATGATPAAWVRTRRLDEARRLLETSELPIDRIAVDCGFGSAVTMRQNFSARFTISPSQYRRRFHAAADGTGPAPTTGA